MMFNVGDYAWDKMTNSVVVIEYISQGDNIKYLVKNNEVGGFRLKHQLLRATTDLDGNPLPTTNEA